MFFSKSFFACLLVTTLGWFTSGTLAEVVVLNDDNFEHLTQASTGATTGSWLILFHTDSCPSCQRAKNMLTALEQHEELYANSIVLASVDVNASPKSAIRFDIKGIPTLIYLHRGRMYQFPPDAEKNLERVKEFILKYYGKSRPMAIPPPPSAFQEVKHVLSKLGKKKTMAAGFVLLGGVLLGTIGMLIATLVTSGGKTKTS